MLLRTNAQPHSRRDDAAIISNSLRFGSHAGKQRLENVGAVVVVRLLAIDGVLCCCVAVLLIAWVVCCVRQS